MKQIIASFILVFSIAAAGSASADECDAMAAKMVLLPDITVKSKNSERVIFTGPGFDMYTKCPGQPLQYLNALWPDNYPPASFFDIIGRAASVALELDAARVAFAAIRCHQAALKGQDAAEFRTGRVVVLCKATAGEPSMIMVQFRRPER